MQHPEISSFKPDMFRRISRTLHHQQPLQLTKANQRPPSTGEYSRWSEPMIFADVAKAKEALYIHSKLIDDDNESKHRMDQQNLPSAHSRNHRSKRRSHAIQQRSPSSEACAKKSDPMLTHRLLPLHNQHVYHATINEEHSTLFVSNLAAETTISDLDKRFSSMIGDDTLIDVRLTTRSDGGKFRTAFAFIDIDDESIAENAILRMNAQNLNGRKMHISWAKTKKMKP